MVKHLAGTLAGLAVVCGAAHVVSAASVYEGFDGSAVGFSSAFSGGTVSPTSLSYGSLQTSGGSLTTTNNGYADVLGRLGDPVAGSSGTVWMSWLYKAPDEVAGGSLDNQWTRLVTQSAGAERWNLGQMGYGEPAGILARGDFMGQGNSPTLAVTPGTTYFIVAAYDFGTAAANDGQITLYVNPDPTSLGTGAAPTGGTVLPTNAGRDEALMNFNELKLVLNGKSTGTVYDEIRIGSTWAEVSPTGVPEPTALAGLIGAAMLGLCRRRRA